MRPDAIDWSHKEGVSLPFLPRQRMHHMLWRWMVLLAISQAVIGAGVLLVIQGSWRGQLVRPGHAETLAQTTAERLAASAREPAAADLTSLTKHAGVAFALVLDEAGQIVTSDAPAGTTWAHLLQTQADPLPELEAEARSLPPQRRVHLVRAPLDHAPGYALVLGVPDHDAGRAVLDGSVALAAGLLIVAGLFLPFAYWRLRHWTIGLANLHTAIRKLAEGAEPKPLPVRGHGEVDYLSIAFNDMASQLMASRRALLEVNKGLEARVAERTEELREAAAQLEELARSDMLTGLPNRRALAAEMQEMFAESVRTDSDLACLAIDLDGFKQVNDILGHASGDELLKHAGELFRQACRSGDLAVRLGGDEFILLIPANDPQAATPLAERLLREFDDYCAARFADSGLPRRPSMSIGIASRKQIQATTADALLRGADAALYRAKGSGKACLRIWQPADAQRLGAAATRPNNSTPANC